MNLLIFFFLLTFSYVFVSHVTPPKRWALFQSATFTVDCLCFSISAKAGKGEWAWMAGLWRAWALCDIVLSASTCRWASQPRKAWTPLPTSQANTLKLWEMKQLACGKLTASSRRSRNHFPITTSAESTTISYLVHSISVSTACPASMLASPVVIRVWFWETGCHHSWWEPSCGVPRQLKCSLDSSVWSCPWLALDFSSPLPSFQPLGLSLCACACQSYSSAWKDLSPDVCMSIAPSIHAGVRYHAFPHPI